MNKIFLLITCIITNAHANWFSSQPEPTCTIMLDPAGDARITGREIDGNFERSISMLCIEQLAHVLKNAHPHIKTIITRAPGEIVPPLQNANYANRLQCDLFITLHFYQTHKTKADLWLYHYSNGNDFITPPAQLSWLSYDLAYLFNYSITKQWAQTLQQALIKHDLYAINGPFKLPLKPLVGIIAPALCIEIGLKKEDDWRACVELLSDALVVMLHQAGILKS